MRPLEELNLSNNKITNVEPEIKDLLRLKVLNLENNNLTDLPEEITQIPFLSTLMLKGNPLSSRFESLLNLKLADNLQDALSACFEEGPVIRTSAAKKT